MQWGSELEQNAVSCCWREGQKVESGVRLEGWFRLVLTSDPETCSYTPFMEFP